MKNTKFCKVCGYQMGEDPFAICDCCGTQRSYEDLTDTKVEELRKKWIANGMRWFNESYRPANWNPEEQLKNIR